jgi:hypothetical protein
MVSRWLKAQQPDFVILVTGSPVENSTIYLRRRSADGDHTHALVAAQSQSFPDNPLALLGEVRAWNCSAQKRSAVGVMGGSLYVEAGST